MRINIGEQMIDIADPDSVEVVLDNEKLWVNVDGVCRLRVIARKGKDFVLTGTHHSIHRPKKSTLRGNSDV